VPKSEKRAGEPPELVQGLRAGLAVFARRRDDIQRVAYCRAVRRDVDELLKWSAASGLSCVETSEREMDRLVHSAPHEGLLVGAMRFHPGPRQGGVFECFRCRWSFHRPDAGAPMSEYGGKS
jgi:tRNA G18 (ribose-2'-O)-methylase SpoU